jgi:hypothetical protein
LALDIAMGICLHDCPCGGYVRGAVSARGCSCRILSTRICLCLSIRGGGFTAPSASSRQSWENLDVCAHMSQLCSQAYILQGHVHVLCKPGLNCLGGWSASPGPCCTVAS